MAKSKLRGGAKQHRKRVASRNQLIKQKKIALTNQIIASMNKQNEDAQNKHKSEVGESI
jgi:hypothetical protein